MSLERGKGNGRAYSSAGPIGKHHLDRPLATAPKPPFAAENTPGDRPQRLIGRRSATNRLRRCMNPRVVRTAVQAPDAETEKTVLTTIASATPNRAIGGGRDFEPPFVGEI